MGQGTESCGGYETEHSPYEEGIGLGYWTQRDGSSIHVSSMTITHLTAAKRLVERRCHEATFLDEADLWAEWATVFQREIQKKQSKTIATPTRTPITAPRGSQCAMICHCGNEYSAREADLKRGWALSCSKRCAAIRRDFGRPSAQRKP